MIAHDVNKHRRSIRLKHYDYSQAGLYFITICTQRRKCLLGNIDHAGIILNDAGRMTQKWYFELEHKFDEIRCMDYMIMPNHIHFIVQNVGPGQKHRFVPACENIAPNQNVGADLCVCLESNVLMGQACENIRPNQNVGADLCVCPESKMPGEHAGSEEGEHTGSPLQRIVQWFKTMSTNEYIRNVKTNNWSPFDGKLWQRNYYEHIVRSEESLNRIREYIANNPLNWPSDENYVGP